MSHSDTSVQHGLRRKKTGKPQTGWWEFPFTCDLQCPYCYADGGRNCLDVAGMLHVGDYIRMLDEAQQLGMDSIGVPGVGEPFFGKYTETTMWFLRECAKRGIYVTLFTTGAHITPELACQLYALPVELMLKCNSLIPEIQDAFVSPVKGRQIHGYGAARDRAIEVLIETGFANYDKCMAEYGRESRMALVTSIMAPKKKGPSNYEEMASILEFCRDRNIIFDCDSILERGRGAGCSLRISGEMIKAKQLELQKLDREKYGRIWEVSKSYLGTTCDRCFHHLYVDYIGNIRPCIGATDVHLGNIRETTLAEAWDSPVMQIIRARKYGGVCGNNCKNFQEELCNCCLGRVACGSNEGEPLTAESILEAGFVNTVGCWNNRPIREEG